MNLYKKSIKMILSAFMTLQMLPTSIVHAEEAEEAEAPVQEAVEAAEAPAEEEQVIVEEPSQPKPEPYVEEAPQEESWEAPAQEEPVYEEPAYVNPEPAQPPVEAEVTLPAEPEPETPVQESPEPLAETVPKEEADPAEGMESPEMTAGEEMTEAAEEAEEPAEEPETAEENAEEQEEDEEVYVLTFTASEGGLVVFEGDEAQSEIRIEISKSEELRAVTAIPEEGYELAGWQKNEQEFRNAEQARIEANEIELANNDKYLAIFRQMQSEEEEEEETEELSYVLTFQAAEGGLIESEGNRTSELTLTVETAEELKDVAAAAEEGYEFLGWKKNGQDFSAETVISAVQMELNDGDIYTAEFAEIIEEEVIKPKKLTGYGAGLIVTVYDDNGALPEKVSMSVSAVPEESVINSVESAVEGTVTRVRAVDITFRDENGNEIEPTKPVRVTITASDIDDANTSVVHIEDNGNATDVGASVQGSTASFETDGFSIYVVVETGEDARLNVNFVNGSDTVSMMINKRQISAIAEYVYDPGVGSLEESEIFKGWSDDPNYTAESSSKTISDVRNDVISALNAGVEDGDSLTYYAMRFKAYNIIYLDEHGVTVKTDHVIYRSDDTSGNHSYTVNQTYTPYAASEEAEGAAAEFLGWQKIESSETGELVIYQNGETIESVNQDINLKAYVKNGYWLSFNENLTNASFTPPQFIYNEKKAEKPEDPVRTGYRFDGWYTEDASEERDGEVAGELFNFSSPVTKNTTVHAKWTKNDSAEYSVIIWKQNVSGEGYDFGESITVKNAEVGSTINAITATGTGNNRSVRINNSTYSYTGFHLSTNAGTGGNGFDTGVVVEAEGNTVVNVYFDRNEYTLTFRRSWNGTVYKTITALYGQAIGDNFPITENGASSEWRWEPQDSETFNQVLVFIDIMPAENVTFYRNTSNAGTKYMEFYVEALPGQSADRTWSGKSFIKYGNTITAKYNFFTEDEDFIDLEGFNKYGSDPKFTNGRADVSSGGTIRFYYTRKEYEIDYRDGVYVDGNDNPITDIAKLPDSYFTKATGIKYGESISDKQNYKPSRDGFVFLGWYKDDTCTEPAEFGTMPANNVDVYAKWVSREYNIVLHANDSEADPIRYTNEGQATSFYVDSGEKIGNVGGERVNYDLVGWYTDENLTQSYDFEVFVINDSIISQYGDASYREEGWPSVVGQLNLYAKWRSKLDGAEGINVVYDATDKGTNPPSDSNQYTDLAEAIAGAAAVSTDPDLVFSNWVVQKWNGSAYEDTDIRVFPGDTFVVRASDAKIMDNDNPNSTATKKYIVQLKAEYTNKEEKIPTHITWYDNFGNIVENYENLDINEAVGIPKAPTHDGYRFLGWAREVEAGSTTESTDLFIEYTEGKYIYNGNEAAQVAADEILVGDGTQYHAMYAVWEAVEAPYTIHHYLKGTTVKVAEDQTGSELIGKDVTAGTAEEFLEEYGGLDLEAESYAPSQAITISEEGTNEITVYYVISVTITTGSDSKAYDGTPLTNEEASITGLISEDEATVIASGSQTEVGSSDNTYSIEWKSEKPDYYTIKENLGTLTVTKNSSEIKLTAASDSKTYDGTALTNATVTASGLPEGFTVEATASGSQTDAGESANVVNDGYVIKDAESNDKTANFTNIQKVDGKLTVNKASVTITTGSDSKAYDGTALTKDDATIEGLVNNETATATATGSQTEVGSSDNTYSIDWGKTNKDNYTIKENLGTLTVTSSDAEVVLTAASDSKTYDGTALTNATVTASGLPEGFTVEATASGSQTDAGESANVVNDGYVIKDAEGNDKTANFTKVEKVDGKLTVNKAPVTITTGSDSKAYDGTPLTNEEASITGLINGESVTLKAIGTITDPDTVPNSYSITWDNAKRSNYDVTENLGTLTVTKNSSEIKLTAASDSKTYDGTALTNATVTASGLP
ncbi:MAG: hypothetical protein E7190_12015, partial [Erysipelotrichaceae bacterium]|nr:hypothetical protein [Erysipelotrichaceae bacterium]